MFNKKFTIELIALFPTKCPNPVRPLAIEYRNVSDIN